MCGYMFQISKSCTVVQLKELQMLSRIANAYMIYRYRSIHKYSKKKEEGPKGMLGHKHKELQTLIIRKQIIPTSALQLERRRVKKAVERD